MPMSEALKEFEEGGCGIFCSWCVAVDTQQHVLAFGPDSDTERDKIRLPSEDIKGRHAVSEGLL